MHGTPVFAPEGGGHPLPTAQATPQRGPAGRAAGFIAVRGQSAADDLDQLVGQHLSVL